MCQALLGPWVWRSRRNYKEGVTYRCWGVLYSTCTTATSSLYSLAASLVTVAWVTVYVLCAGEAHQGRW